MVTGVEATPAFLEWFQLWGQVVYLAVQMAFWAAIGFAAVMVAVQYKRFVDAKVGRMNAKMAAEQGVAPQAPAADIKIDEFVE